MMVTCAGILSIVPLLAIVLVCCVVIGGSPLGTLGASAGPGDPGRLAIPRRWAQTEVIAAQSCGDLPWSVLGALGWLASRSGRLDVGTPPPWWAVDGGIFGVVVTRTEPPLTQMQSAKRAARAICQAEANAGSLSAGLGQLLGNASWTLDVEVLAVSLRESPTLLDRDATAIDFAVHALGTPYVWGGNGPSGYDCSGLIVAAERAAGRSVPRTAQAQHDMARPSLPPGRPGDLAFFGSSPADIGHVGLIIGSGLMIDAPHTGAVVRIESSAWTELVDEGAIRP